MAHLWLHERKMHILNSACNFFSSQEYNWINIYVHLPTYLADYSTLIHYCWVQIAIAMLCVSWDMPSTPSPLGSPDGSGDPEINMPSSSHIVLWWTVIPRQSWCNPCWVLPAWAASQLCRSTWAGQAQPWQRIEPFLCANATNWTETARYATLACYAALACYATAAPFAGILTAIHIVATLGNYGKDVYSQRQLVVRYICHKNSRLTIQNYFSCVCWVNLYISIFECKDYYIIIISGNVSEHALEI